MRTFLDLAAESMLMASGVPSEAVGNARGRITSHSQYVFRTLESTSKLLPSSFKASTSSNHQKVTV